MRFNNDWSSRHNTRSRFSFFAVISLNATQPERHFKLTAYDLALINPNTLTCSIFRTRTDAELTKRIYRNVPVLINEHSDDNPWGASFLRMSDMSNDSEQFRTRTQLEAESYILHGNRFQRGGEVYLPLYEAKMIWQFDHRYGSYASRDDGGGFSALPEPFEEDYQNASYLPIPYYWVADIDASQRVQNWPHHWFMIFRDVINAVVFRTFIFSLLPLVGVGNSAPLLLIEQSAPSASCLLANLNSLVFDYATHQKIAGAHMNFFFVKQLPTLTPDRYSSADSVYIVPRVLKLVYTAWDIKPFADDVWREADEAVRATLQGQWQTNREVTGGGHAGAELPTWVESAADGFPHPPFMWAEDRRAVLRAALDAYYAYLYGLSHDELRYILDPADVYGPEFPGKTFRVLKEKEIKQYGEYRTRRLVLEAWERLGFSKEEPN